MWRQGASARAERRLRVIESRKVPLTEVIEIRGARENDLKDVSLRIPKRRRMMSASVSGPDKSSIVFDTIATEAQRQPYDYFSL